MLLIYRKLPAKTIRKDAKDMRMKCNEFLNTNPRRRFIRVKVWYDKLAIIRRGHVNEDVDKAVETALGH